MAKSKPHDHPRIRHRGHGASDEFSLGTEKLRARIAQVEELKKDGLPYLDALKVRAKLQIRETIREVFGERSPEFQQYKHYRIRACTPPEIAAALAMLQDLIGRLEDKKLDILDGGHRYADRLAGAQHVGRRSDVVAAASVEGVAPTPARPVIIATPPPATVRPMSPVAPMASSPAGTPPAPPAVHALPPPIVPTQSPPLSAAPAPPAHSATAAPRASLPAAAPSPVPAASAPPQAAAMAPLPVPPMPTARAGAATQPPPDAAFATVDALTRIRKICTRLHAVARQLRQRREERATLEVEDESDAQDVIQALLYLEFDDISTDEWTPSYANGVNRTDIVLKREGIVLQVKRTRHGLGAREIAAQLAVDAQRYSTHPFCRTLFHFVYDPEGRIGNPRGLEAKLTQVTDGRTIEVLISPK